MKKLLTGLLMFSRAAISAASDRGSNDCASVCPQQMPRRAVVEATTIDKNNYNQYLCDDTLFDVGRPYQMGHYEDNDPRETTQPIAIKDDYRLHCAAKVSYEKAVEDNAFNVMYTGREGAFLTSKVDTFGVLYAQSCEKLKKDKIDMPHAWIHAMREITPCTRPTR